MVRETGADATVCGAVSVVVVVVVVVVVAVARLAVSGRTAPQLLLCVPLTLMDSPAS
ncbi:hypothetical protein ACTXL6_22230 [Brachybacterium tyrofermentans]|uniref:hypothetical protein n=1 Tax=Brachybacterium tyrofermentans TaxID=47848 RepID=UPI003FCF02D5